MKHILQGFDEDLEKLSRKWARQCYNDNRGVCRINGKTIKSIIQKSEFFF